MSTLRCQVHLRLGTLFPSCGDVSVCTRRRGGGEERKAGRGRGKEKGEERRGTERGGGELTMCEYGLKYM